MKLSQEEMDVLGQIRTMLANRVSHASKVAECEIEKKKLYVIEKVIAICKFDL